ncbi:ABC-type transport auxiliary lipoprotein family protein [Propionivibrio sp.]|uniref:ABC-type transport auxiliary lipoprotein family protein n=1 Tax=Propionivibrio sp. TaxID=2212460 RepID=UPI00260AB003|nr:ABC-type transport auxiliary lipoprotein family protein [Propionivibrio sp.]
MKKIFILFAVVLLGGCIGGARNAPPVVVYDFGLPAARLFTDGRWSGLALEVRSPSWFDAPNVDYRLAYADQKMPREYSGSRWADAPGVLLAQLLRQQLGVARVGGSATIDCLLKVELQEFSQIFDSPQQSRGVVQGSVRLIDAKRQLVGEWQMTIEIPAASPDAQGGVNALVAASSEFGRQLADWLLALGKDKAIKSCRAGQA